METGDFNCPESQHRLTHLPHQLFITSGDSCAVAAHTNEVAAARGLLPLSGHCQQLVIALYVQLIAGRRAEKPLDRLDVAADHPSAGPRQVQCSQLASSPNMAGHCSQPIFVCTAPRA